MGSNKNKLLTDEEIIQRYLDGESPSVIARAANISDRSIRRIMNRHGQETRESGKPRQYKLNEKFFKIWTPEMAYVLGMIVTDGSIYTQNYSTRFEITQKEPEILYLIRDVMQSDQPISQYDSTCNAHRLFIYSVEMVNDLKRLGITERKSLTIGLPNVPKEYLSHFIRGVFDGDGWIQDRGYTANITTASIELANSLLQVFTELDFSCEIRTQSQARLNPIYRVFIVGADSVNRFGNWIYQDCSDLFLPRKYQRFRELGQLNLFSV